MTRFERALSREIAGNLLLALASLAGIVSVVLAVRFLGKTVLAGIPGEGIAPMLGFALLNLAPSLLTLALFLGVFLTLTRQISDHEQVIWSCSGQPASAWFRPILRVALPASLAIAALTLAFNPWLQQKRAEFEQIQARQKEALALTPGLFSESGADNRIFFVEALSEAGAEAQSVFIRERHGLREAVVLSSRGHVETTPASGERFLSLDRGRRYEFSPGKAEYRMMDFDRYLARMDPAPIDQINASPRRRDSLALLQSPIPENLAELSWRLGLPVSALLLALLAWPLAQFNPRAGRGIHGLFAILAFATYINLLGVSGNWIAQGRLGFTASMAAVHGAAFALLAGLMLRHGIRLQRLWQAILGRTE